MPYDNSIRMKAEARTIAAFTSRVETPDDTNGQLRSASFATTSGISARQDLHPTQIMPLLPGTIPVLSPQPDPTLPFQSYPTQVLQGSWNTPPGLGSQALTHLPTVQGWIGIPWTLPCGGRYTETFKSRFSYPVLNEDKIIAALVREVAAAMEDENLLGALVPDAIIENILRNTGQARFRTSWFQGMIDHAAKQEECQFQATQGCYFKFCMGGAKCVPTVLNCKILGNPVDVERDVTSAHAPMAVPGVPAEFIYGWGRFNMEVTYSCDCK